MYKFSPSVPSHVVQTIIRFQMPSLNNFQKRSGNNFIQSSTPSKRMKPTYATESENDCISIQEAAIKFGWDISEQQQDFSTDKRVVELPLRAIRRPLQGVRSNNQEKVDVLKQSIKEVGLLEPIDVLEVDNQYYGFSGCHRFQAHQELGLETILCRVRKGTPQILRYHMM